MFRYVLVLMLLNGSYHSLGNPVNPNASVAILNAITTLANICKNEFLSSQIKARTSDCMELKSPHGEKQLQCLLFYDINKQLCESIAAGNTTLTPGDHLSIINEEQDASTLCLSAKDWVFSDLTEFARYKETVDKVFKHPVACGKICSDEDFMSDDANFYCKYFKWGSDILRQTVKPTQPNVAAAEAGVADVEKKPVVENNDLQDVQINSKTSAPVSNNVAKNDAPVKQETTSVGQKSSVGPGDNAVVAEPENADTSVDNIEDTGAMPENNIGDNSASKSPEITPLQDAGNSAANSKASADAQKPDDAQKAEDKEIQMLNSELENKQPVLETPKDKAQSEIEDYQDSEEGKDGLSDTIGGDDGDPSDMAEDIKPVKKVEPVAPYMGEKESVYANPIQDAFPEEEDHFFSFFLTAVILVVLLYVLYHNKNKVSKMFFGLILEGRQGRRRNSRGHAYRRLDTLEQAMTTSSTAPPSKIIY